MKCPSCSCENLPVREAATIRGVMDSVVKLPAFCAQCGAALTEKCPVCRFQHAIGTKFCQAKGTDIEAWRREERAWKQLVQSLEATLTVRPACELLAVIVSVLPALYFVGGFLYHETMREWRSEQDVAVLVMGWAFTLLVTGFAMLLSMGVPAFIIWAVETNRKRKLFADQQYRTLEDTNEVISA